MIHRNHQPARKGLHDTAILDAKRLRVLRNAEQLAPISDLMASTIVAFQRKRLAYSDQGDFTRCYRGGF